MIWNSLFGPPPAPPPQLPVVRNITIGRSVTLDTLAWRRLGSETLFRLDRDTLVITAQGHITLDDGSHVHRFYTDDEIILQAVSFAADGSDADDFTVFHGWASSYPPDGRSRSGFLDRLRRATYEVEGKSYDRFWYDGDARDQDPVRLWEAIYESRSGAPLRHVAQTCMLYSRPIGEDGSELLLAVEIAPEEGDIVQELMVGIPLTPAEFSA